MFLPNWVWRWALGACAFGVRARVPRRTSWVTGTSPTSLLRFGIALVALRNHWDPLGKLGERGKRGGPEWAESPLGIRCVQVLFLLDCLLIRSLSNCLSHARRHGLYRDVALVRLWFVMLLQCPYCPCAFSVAIRRGSSRELPVVWM